MSEDVLVYVHIMSEDVLDRLREHNLQDPSNGRKIIPDGKLKKLLKLQKNDELTYFNLQKYMSPHFAKKGDTAPKKPTGDTKPLPSTGGESLS